MARMKLPPKSVPEASQIGELLSRTATNTGSGNNQDRQKASEWWGAEILKIRKRLQQQER